jgi:hypothetical protein
VTQSVCSAGYLASQSPHAPGLQGRQPIGSEKSTLGFICLGLTEKMRCASGRRGRGSKEPMTFQQFALLALLSGLMATFAIDRWRSRDS